MYNLTVDEAHTFYVGDGRWLVHNDSCRSAARAAMRAMGLENVDLYGRSYSSGRKVLEAAGFHINRITKSGRVEFVNDRTGAKVMYDSGRALVGNQKPHWHIVDKAGNSHDRLGRIVDGGEDAAHIPGR